MFDIRKAIKALCAAALTFAMVGSAQAAFIAYDSTRTAGNQGWPGALGMDFDVLTPILITDLGAYDSAADGFVGTIQVGIFDRSGSLVSPIASLTGTTQPLGGSGYTRFADIADFWLAPGQYSIVAVGFSNADLNGNTGGDPAGGPTLNTGNGAIQFVGFSRYDGTSTLHLPSIEDKNGAPGPVNRYDAGSFRYEVPLPGTLALLGIAAAMAGLTGRRRRS